MAIDWRHETYRRLYVIERGSFARLPALCRGLAAELLKLCDDEGRIDVGDEAPVAVVCRMLGAHTGERRLIREYLPDLIRDGYIAHEGRALVVRNFAAAQHPCRDEESTKPARVGRESTTNATRTEHESDASRARVGNESTTKGDVTPRKVSSHVSLPSFPLREDSDDSPIGESASATAATTAAKASPPAPAASKAEPTPPAGTPPPGATGKLPGLDGTDPVAPKAKRRPPKPAAEPVLPFTIAAALDALATAAAGRFVTGEPRDYGERGTCIQITAKIKKYPTLAEWTVCGAYLAAGGLGFIREALGPLWVAGASFGQAMGAARAWDADGRGAVEIARPGARRSSSTAPSPAAAFAPDAPDAWGVLAQPLAAAGASCP